MSPFLVSEEDKSLIIFKHKRMCSLFDFRKSLSTIVTVHPDDPPSIRFGLLNKSKSMLVWGDVAP